VFHQAYTKSSDVNTGDTINSAENNYAAVVAAVFAVAVTFGNGSAVPF
jgi:hypothetical protein